MKKIRTQQLEPQTNPSTESSAIPKNLWICGAIFLAALAVSVVISMIGLTRDLNEIYSFRQTQTALTSYYMLKGGPFWSYETPVLGPPWSIPMEVPLYQWIVAMLARISGFALEPVGRIVSLAFFYLSIPAGWMILRRLELGRERSLLVLALLLISPQYLFWSRTFMIESTALFFCLAYLASVLGYRDERHPKWLIGGAVFGVLAAWVKATTFLPFLVAAVFVWIGNPVRLSEKFRESRSAFLRLHVPTLTAFFAIPVLSLLAWTRYADHLKSLNPLAADFITSSALSAWNFGTWEQKLSWATWEMFIERITYDLLGHYYAFYGFLILCFFGAMKDLSKAALSFFLFVLALAVFTNLHWVHSYYAYANGIFLIAAVGWVASGLVLAKPIWRQALGSLFLTGVAALCLLHWQQVYLPWQTTQGWMELPSEIKKALHSKTSDADVVLVYGADWSPEFSYYLQRRAVMDRELLPLDHPKMVQSFSELKNSGSKIGGLIFCFRAAAISETFQAERARALGLDPTTRTLDRKCVLYTRES